MPLVTSRCHQELLERRALEGLRNGERKVTAQILDCFVAYVIDKGSITLFAKSKFVVPDEAPSLLLVREIQSVPIENRPPTQNQPNSFDIMQREIVDGLQPLATTWG